MATSPRPGVIQLDHPNMYMAAKEAQKDDWVRRGINLAGDFFQERNRDIRYRRAKGKKDDRYTTEDLVKQGLPKAWEGTKSGIKSVAENAWGLLKAPFADEAPMAPTTAEEYRTEVGEKKTSPLAEGPSDILDRPEQILNAPRITTEVDGLPSTQTAEPGVKVSFPTTVAGTVERSKLPDTVVPLPEEKAPETPQSDAADQKDNVPEGMLQSPDWSEMFRLDPKRAAYDWGRERDMMANETRQKVGSRNAQAWRAANAEHDRPIRTEMEKKAISLFEDVRSGALDKNSSEYVSRRGEIGMLNAQLINRYPTTSFDRLLKEGVVDKSLALREEGIALNRDKEEQRRLESTSKFAESAGKQIMSGYGDLLKKIETRGTMLESFRNGTLKAIAEKSSATFAAALKSLIQSLDNSVVMQGEWAPFENASWLDRAKGWLEKQSNNTTFSGEEMRQAWVTAKAWAESTKTLVEWSKDTAQEQAERYPGLRRQDIDPKEVYGYVEAALDAYVPQSDFSVEPEWPDVLDVSSPTLRGGKGAATDILAPTTKDAGSPTDPLVKQTQAEVEYATENDLW